ncbi:MAG: carboxypeptidase regulatory-like domain-containing protein [Tannerellaceae bacterium]|nr:carboxypeptidase regulatory-like domain-containing protein [Tannerellaceae bacterium]
MKSKIILHLTSAILGFLFVFNSYAQVTTSSVHGWVTDGKEPLPGAAVVATHQPSGSRYSTVSNESGRYLLQGMRTGGPYTIEVSFIGFHPYSKSDIYLSLGEASIIDISLTESSQELNEIVISASRSFKSQQTGAADNFARTTIEAIPSISRSIYDVTKLTPQAVAVGGGMSFAGSNNRYNSFQIDGTVNNDVFGLASSGTNGGQAGANPISLDAIEEIQVVIAPFDVRQSGFTGAGINAITKSGTNNFHASAYGYYNNQDFTGTTAGKDVSERIKLSEQSDQTYGFTVGGPIIKDKLFFFASAEQAKKTYPSSYNVGEGSNVTQTEADQIVNKLKTLTGGYDGGGYGLQDINTESTRLLGRVDWNINEKNKLSARYSYLQAEQLIFSNSPNTLRLNNNGYTMNNTTHSIITELTSNISSEWFNELRVGFTSVRDFREIPGQAIPYIRINLTNSRNVELGSERYSPANYLNQDIWTLTDNVTYHKGNHELTFGTHNEFFTMENLFIRENYGSYVYNSIDDFLSIGTADEKAPYEYNYSFSREDITGSKRWAPTFSAAQLAFYVQDNWMVNNLFHLSYGLRIDIPLFMDKPGTNQTFNESAIAKQYDVATNQMPASTPLFSPRIGFRWYLNETRRSLIRGGAGIFTGRIPFVWISNSFSNTGVEYSRTRLQSRDMEAAVADGFKFQIDPSKQYQPSSRMTSEIDVVAKDFKFPQVLRTNLAFDYSFENGLKATVEGLYSKTLNNVLYKNLVVEESGKFLQNGGDKRPLYQQVINPTTNQSYTQEYTGIVYLDNSDKGYTYNLTGKLEKSFDFGLDLMVAYTFGHSKGMNDGTSSQALSNWQYNENRQGANNPELSWSDFDVPHRIVGSVSYRKEYAHHFATTVSLLYNGQSGSRYSLCYQNNINNDGASGNDVIYIPTDAELANMNFKDITSGGAVVATVEQQRTDLSNWINSNADLKTRKGSYIERNGMLAPFENHFDLHIAQDFYVKIGGRRNTIQVSFDILNIGNLLNRAWGIYNSTGYSYTPIAVSSVDANGVPTFQFTKPASETLYGISDYNSRWRSQIGIRYIF